MFFSEKYYENTRDNKYSSMEASTATSADMSLIHYQFLC